MAGLSRAVTRIISRSFAPGTSLDHPTVEDHALPSTVHRFAATQGTDVRLMEVSTIELDDVERIEDDYSRT